MSNLKTVLDGFAGFVATEIAAAGVLKGDGRPDLKPEMDGKPKGTLYKDNAVTDGAVLWLKTGNGNNWKVISGDTGWLTLKRTASLMPNSFVKIRRLGDAVFYSFGGGTWGWFGIVRRGGPNKVRLRKKVAELLRLAAFLKASALLLRWLVRPTKTVRRFTAPSIWAV